MAKSKMFKMPKLFYLVIVLLGFFLILFDLTPKHNIENHMFIYRNDPDILGGIILLFFGGFGLGNK